MSPCGQKDNMNQQDTVIYNRNLDKKKQDTIVTQLLDMVGISTVF